MRKWACLALAAGWLLAPAAPAQLRAAAAAAKAEDPAAAANWVVLNPLDFQVEFKNIRYPHMDAEGNVTFIADDSTEGLKTGHFGIYRCTLADKKLVCLVHAGETAVPGSDATLQSVSGLQMDENSVDFVFRGGDSDGQTGFYHWSNGKLETVARTRETIPAGETEPLSMIQYGAMQGTRVLYEATTAKHNGVLVLHDLKTGVDRIVFRNGTPIPGRDDEKFRYLATQNWITADSIIFRAASASNPGRSDAKGTMGVYGWFGIKDWSANSADLAPDKLRTILDGGTRLSLPGVPDDATFDSVGSTPIDGNYTAFQASGDGFSGIFYAKTPGGPVRNIVSNHTEFNGPFKGTFSDFGIWPSVLGPNVIFTAEAQETEADDDDTADNPENKVGRTYKGVFVYRLDRKEVFTLVDNRAQIAGKDVEGFEIGGHFMAKDRFVVTVNFKDNASQIFLGTIQPEAFKKITGEPARPAPKSTPTPAP